MEPPKITTKEITAVKSENANNIAMAFIAKLKANITSIIEIALLIVSLYVDDIIYIGNNESMVQWFKQEMMKTFEITNLGLMPYFLGIEVCQEDDEILIHQ